MAKKLLIWLFKGNLLSWSLTVIRKLRATGVAQVPIIATSVKVPISHRSILLAAGCAAHIEKPVEPDKKGHAPYEESMAQPF